MYYLRYLTETLTFTTLYDILTLIDNGLNLHKNIGGNNYEANPKKN